MAHAAPNSNDYDRIEDAIRFLAEHRADQPELGDVASHVGLSGPGRLHDLFISLNAVNPGEYKSRGEGMVFIYGFHPSPFGECLAVMSDRGLTGLSFVVDEDREAAIADQKAGWENASWLEDGDAGADVVAATFRAFFGNPIDQKPLSLLMRGTPYRVRVWEALMRIPPGCVTTYGEMADRMGCGRRAARALGGACASNRIGVLIPCHRVIRDTGAITGYRWGPKKKLAILTLEAAMAPEIQAAG